MRDPETKTQCGISWHDAEHTILICRAFPKWTWADAELSLQRIDRLCSASSHPIATIIHCPMTNTTPMPQGRAIPNLRHLLQFLSPNNKLVVLVGANAYLQHLLLVTAQVYHLNSKFTRFRFVDSMDEALVLVAKVNPPGATKQEFAAL